MGGGWRNAALARFAKVRDYVASSEVPKSAYAAVSNRVVAYRTGFDPVTGEKRQTWEEWAREKRQRLVHSRGLTKWMLIVFVVQAKRGAKRGREIGSFPGMGSEEVSPRGISCEYATW
jgi:hypothetical protein